MSRERRRRKENGNGRLGKLFDRFRDAPEWMKNALAFGAVLVLVLGIRGDIANIDARQDRQAERLDRQEIRIDNQAAALRDHDREIAQNDRQIQQQRQFSTDIDKDLQRILEAIRRVDEPRS